LKQGEKISNFENASQKSYSFTFDYLQKNFEEDLQKNLQKTKHMVQAWYKIVKNEGTIHAYLISIYIG
jgi:RecB family endonuclease NucS